MKTYIDPNEPIFSITDMAEKFNVYQRTLRIYDDVKILSPKRTQKNRRRYSLNDLKKCELILFLLRNLAMNLIGVKLFLSLFDRYKIDQAILNQLLLEIGINEQMQQENIIKTKRRGRKPKSKQ